MNHVAPSLDRLALSATVHCLTGCGIGEVLGMVIATQLGWHDIAAIAVAVVLAFVFGYALTLRPLLGSGMAVPAALGLAFTADTISITVMEPRNSSWDVPSVSRVVCPSPGTRCGAKPGVELSRDGRRPRTPSGCCAGAIAHHGGVDLPTAHARPQPVAANHGLTLVLMG